jgi:hypothetical protein
VNVYNFALMLGGILAFGMIVFGAVKYTMSGGNPSGQSDARDVITQALLGLLLLMGAFIVLNLINPELTRLNLPLPGPVQAPKEGQAPVGPGALAPGQENVMAQLQAGGVTVVGGINLAGIRQATVDEAIRLKRACGCEVVITSATGGQHAPGTYSHASGYKIDLRLDSGLTGYIENPNNFDRVGTRSDGAPLYQRPGGGAIYAKESDHWDVTVIPGG